MYSIEGKWQVVIIIIKNTNILETIQLFRSLPLIILQQTGFFQQHQLFPWTAIQVQQNLLVFSNYDSCFQNIYTFLAKQLGGGGERKQGGGNPGRKGGGKYTGDGRREKRGRVAGEIGKFSQHDIA